MACGRRLHSQQQEFLTVYECVDKVPTLRTTAITINQTVDCMARGFMSFMRGVDFTRPIGRVGLKVEPVLGPEIARATESAIWAQNRRLDSIPYRAI